MKRFELVMQQPNIRMLLCFSLYVMDEIDAALDFKNVSIVANYIKERTRDAQFIIISLRNNMFECADRLVGKCHDYPKPCLPCAIY